MYARKWPLPLCVYSVVLNVKLRSYGHKDPEINNIAQLSLHHKNIFKLRHAISKGRFGWIAAMQIFKKICQFAELNKFLLFDLCLIADLWTFGCQTVQSDKMFQIWKK
jgi:hypothetical protein